MKTTHRMLVLPALLLALPLFAAPVNLTPGDASLHCAQVRLSASAHCFQAANATQQCSQQTLTLEDLHTGKQQTLAQGGKLVRTAVSVQKILDSTVTHWACLRAPSGTQYLYLRHTAATGQTPACANGTQEFTSLFTLDGKHLTQGMCGNTPQREQLNASLGLTPLFEQGVNPEPVTYHPLTPPNLLPPPEKPKL
jgi:hypothetical protein